MKTDLTLAEGMQDAYHAAASCKKVFDKFMHNVMRVVKPKVTREFTHWDDWTAAIDNAASSKRNAVNADVAELDAVHAAVIFQPLKDKERTEKKAKENYRGHINRVQDIVRGSIVCESDKDIAALLKMITEITSVYIPLELVAPKKAHGAHNKKNERGMAFTMKSQEQGSLSGSVVGNSGGGDDNDDKSVSATSQSEQTMQSIPMPSGQAQAGQYNEMVKTRNREIVKGMRIVSVKNRFKVPTAHGYRDIIITFAIDYIHEVEAAHGAAILGQEPVLERAQCLCELQIHHADLLYFANSMDSWTYYAFFRTFFADSEVVTTVVDKPKTATNAGGSVSKITGARLHSDPALAFQNKLKALKTMDQVGEFVEQLEAAMQVYLGGVGRVGRDLPRLSAFFSLFVRVGEVELAEAMQTSIIQQLRAQERLSELYQELSSLAKYFKGLKRYEHAKPLSEEALHLCEQLMGAEHIETANQLTNHANLLYCCEQLDEALPLFERALQLKQKLLGDLNPITYQALDQLASVHYDSGNFPMAVMLYKEVLETHRAIARQSRTGQAGPEVAVAMVNLARIYEVDLNLRDFDKCYKLLDEVLVIYEDFYGVDHESRAEVWENMANLKDQEGLLSEALALHRLSLNLRQQLFSAASEYMGLQEDDERGNPPWPTIADSLNAVSEILLDLGEIQEAIPLLRRAVHMRTVLAEPHHYHLSKGQENALMALATCQTNLAMAIIQGEKRAHHTDAYMEAREIIKPAYAVRMKYLGVRAIQTEQTLNVQGMIEELIVDYAAEKEKIQMEKRYAVEKAEKQAAKQAVRDAKALLEANTNASSNNVLAIGGTGNSNSAHKLEPVSNVTPSNSSTPTNIKTNPIPSNTPPNGPSGKNGATGPGAEAEATTKSPTRAPVAVKIGQKVTQASLLVEEEVAEEVEIAKEIDELYGHIHSRGINDIGARQQLDLPVAKAHELLDAAENLRVLGEHDSALKCSYEALAHLRPDLYAKTMENKNSRSKNADAASVTSGSTNVSLAMGLLPADKAPAPPPRGPERKLAFAVALSCLGASQMDKGWFGLAVQTFQQSLDLIILTYGENFVHRDIAQGLSALALALRCAGHSEEAIEAALHARTQWVAIIRKDSVNKMRISQEENEALEALGEESGSMVFHSPSKGKLEEPSEMTNGMWRYGGSIGSVDGGSLVGGGGGGNIAGGGSIASMGSLGKMGSVAEGKGYTEDKDDNSFAFMVPEDGPDAESEEVEKVKDPLEDPEWYDPMHLEAYQVTKIDHMLALALLAVGKTEEAHARCLDCLASLRKHHQSDAHPDVIAVLNTRGFVEAHMGDFEATWETFSDNMKLRIRAYGSSDPAYALSMNNFGSSLFMLDDMAVAGRVWTESLELRERQVAVPSIAVSTGLHNISALFVRQENEQEAEPFLYGKSIIDTFLHSQFGEPGSLAPGTKIDAAAAAATES